MNCMAMNNSLWTTNSQSLSNFEFSHFCHYCQILFDSCRHSLLNYQLKLPLLTDRVLDKLDNGMLTGAVFLDLSKAFDTIDHGLLLEKLKQIGACDNVVGWFRNNRFQLTVVGDVQSPLRPIQVSVPQGSILGPL